MAYQPLSGKLIDPWEGRKDLTKRRIRLVALWALKKDPLRILRAFRLSLQLSFHITPDTLELISRYAPLLQQTPKERIRDELSIMLGHPQTHKALIAMASERVIENLIPEIEAGKGILQGKWWGTDLKHHLLGTMGALERILPFLDAFFPEDGQFIKEILQEEWEGSYSLEKILKVSALLHDIGKPKTMECETRISPFGDTIEKGGRLPI
jgi:tRNA nucleotidyltransferase/poly(A) polymerase